MTEDTVTFNVKARHPYRNNPEVKSHRIQLQTARADVVTNMFFQFRHPGATRHTLATAKAGQARGKGRFDTSVPGLARTSSEGYPGSPRDVVSTRNACVSERKHDPGRSILRERASPQRGENPNTRNTAKETEE